MRLAPALLTLAVAAPATAQDAPTDRLSGAWDAIAAVSAGDASAESVDVVERVGFTTHAFEAGRLDCAHVLAPADDQTDERTEAAANILEPLGEIETVEEVSRCEARLDVEPGAMTPEAFTDACLTFLEDKGIRAEARPPSENSAGASGSADAETGGAPDLLRAACDLTTGGAMTLTVHLLGLPADAKQTTD